MALNPTLAAGVVIVAYKNKLTPMRAEDRTIAHLRPKLGISMRAAPRSTPGTPTTAIMMLNSNEWDEVRITSATRIEREKRRTSSYT